MKLNNKKNGSILGFASILIKNVFSFFLTPLMILVFGRGNFGIYEIVLSTTGYFMLLDMGMHNVIVKYISKYKQLGDIPAQKKYLGLVQVFYIIISFIIIAISIITYILIPKLFSKSLTYNEIELFSQIFILLSVNSIVLMLFNAYGGIIKSHEKYILFQMLDIGRTILRSTLMYFFLVNNLGIIFVAAVDVFVNSFFGLFKLLYVVFRLKLKPQVKGIKKDELLEVFYYSSFIFLNMIALQLFWASDNIILGIMTNSTIVAIYAVGTVINNYFQAIGNVFSEFLMPSAVKMVENNCSKEEITNECARIGRYIFIFLGLIIVGFAFLGDKFIILWLGENFKLAYPIGLIVMIPQLFTYPQHFAANVMWAKSRHQKRAKVMLFISLLNVLITILLVKIIGVIGAAIGTSFAYIVGYIFYSTWYYHKYIDIDMIVFTKKLFSKVNFAIIPIIFLSSIIRIILPNITWSSFILQGCLVTIVYCGFMYLFGMYDSERNVVREIIKCSYHK